MDHLVPPTRLARLYLGAECLCIRRGSRRDALDDAFTWNALAMI